DNALLIKNKPFYYPDYTKDIHHEIEIIIKICEAGKCIDKRFAHKYYKEIGLGIDFTARDLQAKAKAKGLPWALAKGFDSSAPISDFVPKSNYVDLQNLNFSLKVNGEERQNGNTSHMLYPIDEIVSYISQFITLKKGDIIFTGTPKGVGPIQIGDRLEGFIEDKKFLDFEVK
ncbi:MAG: fumarylacetoacetate hydrolase family protein, partial [Flammeovirgaceae bacterium]|nr:fumarylacetoacetate hydrolase family protein [Flammeovirgaceae bacterium]